MNVETVSIAALVADPANARKHSPKNLEAIKGSLAKFGQQKPIVVGKNGVVIAGNGTMEAARSLGWTELQIVRTDLEGPEAIAFTVADNRTGELAEWDAGVLSETLKSLQEMDFDLGAIGFDEKDLLGMIATPEPTEGLTDADEVPEQVETRCKPGDLWVLGSHRLLCGDSTNVQHVEMLMGGEKADICFTSPPYNAGKGGWLQHGKDLNLPNNQKYLSGGDDRTDDDYSTLLNDFTALALTWCRYVFVNLQMLKHNRLPLIDYQHRHREQLKDIFIWNKANCAPNIVKGAFNTKFEFVYCFSKDDAATRAFPVDWQGKHYNVVETRHNGNNEFATVHQAGFPVEFPVWFLERLDFAQIVYEPFCGTGTTMIACEQHHRACYGIELEPKYCDVILARWEAFTGQTAVLCNERGEQ